MSISVLVVDDIPINVKLLEARLASHNLSVLTACNGAEALDICRHQKVDLLILDLEMPQMTGFEVCRRLKSDERTKNIPIIVMTAHDEDFEKVKAYQMGADDVLSKPLDERALMTRIENLLKQKKLKDEISKRELSFKPLGLSRKDLLSLSELLNIKEESRLLFLDESTRLIAKVLSALSDKHSVIVETSSNNARQKLQDHTFDLFILNAWDSQDAHDPHEETLKFCREIRSHHTTAQLPILLIVPASEDILDAALKEGVNDYVRTPIHHFDLLARVQGQLTTQRLARYLASLENH